MPVILLKSSSQIFGEDELSIAKVLERQQVRRLFAHQKKLLFPFSA